jgi:hypothetical protein
MILPSVCLYQLMDDVDMIAAIDTKGYMTHPKRAAQSVSKAKLANKYGGILEIPNIMS